MKAFVRQEKWAWLLCYHSKQGFYYRCIKLQFAYIRQQVKYKYLKMVVVKISLVKFHHCTAKS